MDTPIDIKFKVTPSQNETIALRAAENGFDDISAYIKVVALKTQKFNVTSAGASTQEPTVEIGFKVTPSQQSTIEENMEESNCKELTTYLRYVAMHAVVSAVVEVRSTGGLDDMLERIAKSRGKSLN